MMARAAVARAACALACVAASAHAFALAPASACTRWGTPGKQLHADDFNGGLAQWTVEAKPGVTVSAADNRMLIDAPTGVTVWLREPLSGNVVINYTRTVILEGGPHDRLSDLNNFWMASDPRNASLFTRDGTLEQYDALQLYYIGMGGNTNSTTRFRRYDGHGARPLLGESSAPADLLVANHPYRIEIAVYEGCTRMLVDGRELFAYRDPQPLRSGYFGLRTTWSRQSISAFTVRALD